ncbi:transforming growth factor beta activator LRRC33-like [Saccostrea echinata]|uniref:transforming growth factor beta activator LRRC33-like n=1 Tax=Saccostrea echinata TaxID=191078 RepID=UPI002A7FB560|nr:transforming growth factor beta activator LRRC33-like [Saccostrea echinata]
MDNHTWGKVCILVFVIMVSFLTKGILSDPCRPVTNHILWCNGSGNSEINQTFITEVLKTKLKSDLQEIHIFNGNFSELPANAFGNCALGGVKLNNLAELVLSNNEISLIHGKTFHCMPNLKKLFLDNNRWQIHMDNKNHTGYFNNLPNLVELDLTSAFYVAENLHIIRFRQVLENSNFRKLETLRLGANDMQFVDDAFGKALCTMDSLKHVNLQLNSLYKLEFTHCFQKAKNLEKIDLSNNALSTLDKRSMDVFDFIRQSNKNFTVNLLGQQWSCDCHIKEFNNWIHNTKVHLTGKDKFICHDGANFHKKIIHLTEAEMVCNDPGIDSSVQAGVVVMIVLLVIIAVAVVVVVVLYRSRLTSFARGVRKSLARESHVQYSSVDNAPLTAEA